MMMIILIINKYEKYDTISRIITLRCEENDDDGDEGNG